MENLPPIIFDLAILFLITSGVAVLFQKIKQPVVIGYLIAGVILGPYTSGFCIESVEQLHGLSELGVIFLMFCIGLEFSFHHLKKIGLPAIITAFIKSGGLIIIGFYIGCWLGWSRYSSLFFGAALSLSSTTIIFKVLEDLNLRQKKFAKLVCGILIVEDLLAVLMLTALTTIVETQNIFSFGIILAGLKLLLVIGSWFFIGYYLTPLIFRKIIHYVTQETITLVSITLCLGLSVIFAYFHYSTALGAFMMGSILAETAHLAHRIKNLMNPLKDVFAAIFFVSVGMGINLLGMISQWQVILIGSVLLISISIMITSVGSFLTGSGWRDAIRIAFSMIPIGEFSFIILSLGVTLKVANANLYQSIVGIAFITTLVTPYLIEFTDKTIVFLEKKWSENFKLKLDNYSYRIYQFLAYREQAVYRRLLFKYLVNILAISIIFISIKFLIVPNLLDIFSGSNVVMFSWILTILSISPFIWNLMTNYHFLPSNKQTFAKIVGMLVIIVSLVIFSVAFFEKWYVALLLTSSLLLIVMLFKRHLGEFLHFIENKLNKNLEQTCKFDRLELMDAPLAEICLEHHDFVGRSLAALHFREKYGLEITSIQRGNRIIEKPKGNFILKFGDLLTLLGNIEQVRAFRKIIQGEVAVNNGFILQTVLLDENSEFVDCKINDSSIQDRFKGQIVGLERHGVRILNPDSATLLKCGDVLLIVSSGQSNMNNS